ncbi:MAG: hypothetical protein ACT4NY_26485 [Pseudonocardiales bacterium]
MAQVEDVIFAAGADCKTDITQGCIVTDPQALADIGPIPKVRLRARSPRMC